MQRLIRFGKENKQFVAGTTLVFILALVYNTLSPYTTDDYAYMYSAVTGERITNIFQIFPSLWDDYMNIHGRIVPHFFLQLFLIGPKWIFNIVNAAMQALLIWLMMRISGSKQYNSLLFWLAIPVALWAFIPAYGQVFFWMSGIVNYSWCYVFALLYMNFYVKLYRNPEKVMGNKKIAILCVYGLFFGAYSELVSFPAVFVSFVILGIVMYKEHAIKKYWKYVIPVVTAAMGYLTMVLSPAQSSRQGEMVLGTILKKLIDVFEEYYLCSEKLLVVWAVLLVLAVCFVADKKKIVISVALLVVSIISIAMLSVASYAVARHYANGLFFLLTAIVVLMQALCEKGNVKCVSYCICAYVIVSNLWSMWEGTYDIYSVYKQQMVREAYIYEQRDADVVYVPLITTSTKYSCKYDLLDMQVNDIEPWPNTAIAKYYGVKEIYGIK